VTSAARQQGVCGMKRAMIAVIALLSILPILACNAGNGAEPTPTPTAVTGKPDYLAYMDDETNLQLTISKWRDRYPNEPIPTINATVLIDGEERYVIDFCYLIGGTDVGDTRLLRPKSAISIDGPDNDNCDNYPSSSPSCNRTHHYIWAMDEIGKVYSACIGDDCWENNKDGFQGVWP